MEPSASPRLSDAVASSSDLTSLISDTTFPWDLSDSEIDDAYVQEFAEEDDLDASEVDSRTALSPTAPRTSAKRVFLRRQTTALIFPTVPVYTDATIDSWSLSVLDGYGNIKRVGTYIKMVTMPTFIAILTASGEIDKNHMEIFFTCYRAFITPLQLVAALNKRLREVEEFSMPEEREGVHKGLCAFLKLWMTDYIDDFVRGGRDVADQTILLLCGPLNTTSKPQVRELAKLLERIATLATQSAGAVSSQSSTPLPPSILPSSGTCLLLDLNHQEIARQLTMLYWRIFSDFKYVELVRLAWVDASQIDTECPVVAEWSQNVQHMTNIILSSILIQQKPAKRAQVVSTWLKVGAALLSIGSMDALFTLVSAIELVDLKSTNDLWDALSEGKRESWGELHQVCGKHSDFQNYRKAWGSLASPKAPAFLVFRSDIDHVKTIYPSSRQFWHGGIEQIFIRKWEVVRDAVTGFLKHQSPPLLFEPLPAFHGFVRTFPAVSVDQVLSLKRYAPKPTEPAHQLLDSLAAVFSKKLTFAHAQKSKK